MSISIRPVFAPYSAAWRTSDATFALWISFLLGRQLTLGQEPPIHRRSTTAVRRPDRAMCHARSLPPAPLPRTRTSKRSDCDMPSSSDAVVLCDLKTLLDGNPVARIRQLITRAISSSLFQRPPRQVSDSKQAC